MIGSESDVGRGQREPPKRFPLLSHNGGGATQGAREVASEYKDATRAALEVPLTLSSSIDMAAPLAKQTHQTTGKPASSNPITPNSPFTFLCPPSLTSNVFQPQAALISANATSKITPSLPLPASNAPTTPSTADTSKLAQAFEAALTLSPPNSSSSLQKIVVAATEDTQIMKGPVHEVAGPSEHPDFLSDKGNITFLVRYRLFCCPLYTV